MIKITEKVHELITGKKDIKLAVDMTVGRGRDFLALTKIANKVIGFDIQKIAIEETKKLVQNEAINYSLIYDNHENIAKYITEPIDLAVYNLGYLPNGDKQIITESNSTLKSLEALLPLMAAKGLVIIVLYPHNQNEIKTIKEYVSSLSSGYDVLDYQILNRLQAPEIITIEKG